MDVLCYAVGAYLPRVGFGSFVIKGESWDP